FEEGAQGHDPRRVRHRRRAERGARLRCGGDGARGDRLLLPGPRAAGGDGSGVTGSGLGARGVRLGREPRQEASSALVVSRSNGEPKKRRAARGGAAGYPTREVPKPKFFVRSTMLCGG